MTQLTSADLTFLKSLNFSDPADCQRYLKWLSKRNQQRGVTAAATGEGPMTKMELRRQAIDDIHGAGTFDKRMAALRTSSRAPRFQPPPDGYEKAMENRALTQHDLHPSMSKGYEPKGQPASGWDLALALRKANAPVVTAATAAPPDPPMVRNAAGIPDGYATALARRTR